VAATQIAYHEIQFVRVVRRSHHIVRLDIPRQRLPGVNLLQIVLGVGEDEIHQRLGRPEQQQVAAVAEEERDLLDDLLLVGLIVTLIVIVIVTLGGLIPLGLRFVRLVRDSSSY
jgi:hypothetical protein